MTGTGTRISSYPTTSTPPTSMMMLGTDPTDTSESASGTTKTTTIAQLVAAAGGGGGGGGGLTGWKDLVGNYSADPTGATSSSTALSSACAAAVAVQPAPFGLTVPPGTFLVTAPQDLPYNMIIRGAGANGGTVTGQRTGSWFSVSPAFSGSYVFGFKDVPAPAPVGSFTGVNGCLVSGIGVYGGNQAGSAVNGFYIVGPAMDTFEYISICQMTGWAVATGTDPGANEQFPFGQNWFRVQADSCGTVAGGGFQLVGCEDSTFTNCYSIGNNNGPGFFINACDNTKFVACNSEWNGTGTSTPQAYGFYVTGDWAYFTGGCTFTACSTDANGIAGFMCDATWSTGLGAGTGPGIIHVTGCHFRRDGQNNGTTTAGIWLGATTLPLIIDGFSTMPSIGDSGGSTYTPAFGMYFSQSSYTQPVIITSGLSWGNTACYRTGSTNSSLPTVTNGFIANIAKAHGPNSAPVYGS